MRNNCVKTLVEVQKKFLEVESDLEQQFKTATALYEHKKQNFEFYSDEEKQAVE